MKIKFILSALIILNQISYSHSQDLDFYHLTTEGGLSNNTVHCVYQDSKGFLWFGTDDGLNMFDGYEFSRFYNSTNDSGSIAGNAVFKVKEDSRGQLWMATNNGIDIYDRDLLCFRHIPFIQENNTILYQDYVRNIIEDDNGDECFQDTQ